jgi:hypothetical protein
MNYSIDDVDKANFKKFISEFKYDENDGRNRNILGTCDPELLCWYLREIKYGNAIIRAEFQDYLWELDYVNKNYEHLVYYPASYKYFKGYFHCHEGCLLVRTTIQIELNFAFDNGSIPCTICYKDELINFKLEFL